MIEDKLKLYNNTYVKGEVRSKEYEARVKQEKELNIKLDLADTMFNELPFYFSQHQKDQVKELILSNKNFNKLHRQASNEEIILSFIFFIKMQDDLTHLSNKECEDLINKFVKPNKRHLYRNTFEIILSRLLLKIMSTTPILPRPARNVDHNILYKGKY